MDSVLEPQECHILMVWTCENAVRMIWMLLAFQFDDGGRKEENKDLEEEFGEEMGEMGVGEEGAG